MKKTITLLCALFVSLTAINNAFSQNASVTINATSTTNGSWSGGTAGPYVFTPSANAATVLNTDIVNRLIGSGGYTKGNVTINTACSSCSDPGDITISNAITAANTNSVVPTLTFNAANNINVNANINLTGATGAAGGLGGGVGGVGGYGANIILKTANASSSIILDSTAAVTIITNGGTGGAGGANFAAGGAGGAGGNAGSITLNSAGACYIKNGSSALAANGGAGGAGGTGSSTGATGATGNANDISLTGAGGITITGNLTATGTVNGNFTINDGNPNVTTGSNGVNNGQTAGIISGGNLTKTGNGTFFIGGTNTYTGTTTVTAGTLRPTNNTVAASTNGPLGNNASGLILNGGAIESNVATFSRPISITASNSRLDAYGAARTISSTITQTVAGTFNLNVGGTTAASAEGQVLTLSGVISNSSGTLSVTKVGTSEVALSAANTFGGGLRLSNGTLDINNASALGNVAGTFTIDSATTIDNTTGAAITTSNYPQVWNGNFTFKGTRALNIGTGTVTVNTDVQVTATTSTLTVGGTINNPTRSLIKAGAGTLTFGSQAITLNNFTINAGTLTSTSGILSLKGNYTNNAAYTHNNGTVSFIGTTAQTIGGNVVTTFYNLTANNTYTISPQLILAKNETVANTLTLTKGNIDAQTNSDTLYVSNTATGAISHTSGYIIGNLKRAFTNTGSPTYTYDLGTSTGYTPVSIATNSLSAGGSIIGSAKSGDFANLCSSAINPGLTVNDYWTFTNSGVTFTSYGATFTYPTADLDAGVTASKFIVGKYSGSWSYPTISGTPTTTVTSISGATTFGNFVIGDTITNKISYPNSPFCNSITAPQPVTLTGAQGGTFSSTSGLTLNSVTGAITPNTSTPATYTVTYTIPAGVCPSTTVTTTVTIKASPTVGITNNTGTTILTCSTTTISVTATGGTSYAWSAGNSTATAANSFTSPGTYTVTVTAANGCTKDSSITITQDLTPPTANIINNTGTTVLNCSTTTISATATGGVSYAWSGGDSLSTATNTFTSPNTYTATVTGSNGCSASKTITITQDITPPTVGITNNTGTTILDCNKTSINVIANGGTNYAWSGGNSLTTAANLFTSPGTYSVTVTGSNGCSASGNITITQDIAPPTVGITNNSGTTILDCDTTSIKVTATGGISYVWSGGDSASTATNTFSTPNTYSVTVTGSNGCSASANITITKDTIPPTAGITNNTGTTVLDCNNTSTSITATGGTNYIWSGGTSTATASNSFTTPGTYSVTVTGNNGCKSDTSITITQDITTPTASIFNNSGRTLLDCDTTAIHVTASGGTTYIWSGGSNTAAAANTFTTPNTYSVTVRGSNGCSASETITITQNVTTPTITITNNTGATVLDCNNTSISVTATGGIRYSWSGGDSTSTASNTFTSPNTYTVVGTGSNGCSSSETIVITRDSTTTGITNNTGTNVLDCNVTSISVTATGGAPYSWSGGSSPTTANNTFTTPGTYTVTVTNNNGCDNKATITILQNTSAPTVNIINNTGKTQLDCNTPSINVTATGGASYSWSGGNTPSTAVNTFTAPNTYSLVVTGSNGCSSATNTITITQNIAAPTVGITNNTNKTVLTCSTTSINVTASGGGTYSWSGGNSTATAATTFTAPNKYFVTVTSGNGCSSKDSITITQDITPAGITNNTGSTVLDCNNSSISVTATGGSSYAWSGGSNPTSASNTFTSIGSYSVTVTNSNGCNNKASITITKNIAKPSAAITNNTGSTEINCRNSFITVTANGGGTYLWTGGNSTATATNSFSSPGTYSVTVTGTNGCVASNSVTITQNFTVPIVSITNNSGGATQINCAHPTINVTATGASTYVWSGGTSTATASNSFTSYGSYNVTGTADNGCSASNNIFLTQDQTLPTVDITPGGNTLLTCLNTSVSATATGADSYTWSGGNSTTTDTNSFTSPGTYIVTGVSTSNGCSDTAAISITQQITLPSIGITNNTGSTVLDCNHTSINITGTGNGNLSWSGGSSPSTANNSFTSPGTYTLTVINNNTGCTNSTSITITQDVSMPTATITNTSGTTILTCAVTSVSVTATGGSSYVWSGGNTPLTAENTFTSPGTYSVIATGANGCTSSASSITITQNDTLPTISIANNTGTTLLSNEHPSIALTASGGTSYNWSGGNTPSSADNTVSSAGTYTVTSIAPNGCAGSASIQIKQLSANVSLTAGNDTSCVGQYSSYTFVVVANNAGTNPTYQWRVNGNNVGANSSTYTSSAVQNGDVVDVTVTTSSVTATSNPVKIAINPLPSKPTVSQNGNTLMSSATSGNQWYLNGVAINGATSQFYPATQAGYYTVQVTSNGCANTSDVTTGIDAYTLSNAITVYPNPFGQQTTVSFNKEVKNATVKIVNSLGATVKETNCSCKQVIINRTELDAGVYFIEVITDGEVIANEKVIVQ